jgi:hypothetical protein
MSATIYIIHKSLFHEFETDLLIFVNEIGIMNRTDLDNMYNMKSSFYVKKMLILTG